MTVFAVNACKADSGRDLGAVGREYSLCGFNHTTRFVTKSFNSFSDVVSYSRLCINT